MRVRAVRAASGCRHLARSFIGVVICHRAALCRHPRPPAAPHRARAAFVVPILEKLYRLRWSSKDGLGALIISPTRELALQIFEVVKQAGQVSGGNYDHDHDDDDDAQVQRTGGVARRRVSSIMSPTASSRVPACLPACWALPIACSATTLCRAASFAAANRSLRSRRPSQVRQQPSPPP